MWGAYSIPSLNGAHYFLTIVDDFSRSTWVYLMRYKSETPFFLKSFVNMVKTQFNLPVRVIRYDNGLEFFGHEIDSLSTMMGSSIGIVVSPHLNKIGSWNENISIYLRLPGHCAFK